MKLVDGKDYFLCEYCTSIYFPEPNLDGVRVLNVMSDAECPIDRIPLVQASVEGNRVLYCPKCSGLLVNQWDFMFFTRYLRARSAEPLTPPRKLNMEELDRHIICPYCRQEMDTHPYMGPGNVIIDNCVNCHVVWLDYGELNRILTAEGGDRGTEIPDTV